MRKAALRSVVLASLATSLLAATASAGTINVPASYPTIQAAVAAATDGDTILVAPGTYSGGIDFAGKSLALESSAGPTQTKIQGGSPVIRMGRQYSGATSAITLRGFTIAGGNGSPGGGVAVGYATGTIERNVIVDNLACGEGGGVNVHFATVTVQHNVIARNGQNSCSGGTGGGGIAVGGDAGMTVIKNNLITDNDWGSSGGGLSVFSAAPSIDGNIIAANSAYNSGGGLWIVNVPSSSAPSVSNNLIVGNSANKGGGLDLLIPSGSAAPRVVNNTIVDNDATTSGSQLELSDTFGAGLDFSNNLVAGSGATLVNCSGTIFPMNNDFFRRGTGARVSGSCTEPLAASNLTVDPLFVNEVGGDYHLQSTSPLIDAGKTPGAATEDFDGDTRALDGNDADTTASWDIGLDEAQEQGNALETSITSSPADFTASVDTSTFTFSSPNPLATFECNFDMLGYAPCASPMSYQGLAGHLHAFQVRSKIGANTDPSPAMGLWRIDPCSIVGTEGADTLSGTAGADVICGLGGDDKILALGGDDIIYGGSGADVIDGGLGRDDISGAAGNDVIEARDGLADTIDCGADTDVAKVDLSLDVRTDCEGVNPADPVVAPGVIRSPVAPTPIAPGPGNFSTFLVKVVPKTGVSIVLGCTRPRGECKMRVSLATTRRVRLASGRLSPPRATAIGSALVTIADGGAQNVSLRLNAAGKKLLRTRRTLKVTVALAIDEAGVFRALTTKQVTVRA